MYPHWLCSVCCVLSVSYRMHKFKDRFIHFSCKILSELNYFLLYWNNLLWNRIFRSLKFVRLFIQKKKWLQIEAIFDFVYMLSLPPVRRECIFSNSWISLFTLSSTQYVSVLRNISSK